MSDLQRRHVLVIDSAEEVAELMRDVLEEEGYVVSIATQTPASLCGGIREEVDLVIVDPGSGGQDLETWVQQNIVCDFEAVDYPLVVCSGHPRVLRDLHDDLVMRNISLLPKPFDLVTFLHVVEGRFTLTGATLLPGGDSGAVP